MPTQIFVLAWDPGRGTPPQGNLWFSWPLRGPRIRKDRLFIIYQACVLLMAVVLFVYWFSDYDNKKITVLLWSVSILPASSYVFYLVWNYPLVVSFKKSKIRVKWLKRRKEYYYTDILFVRIERNPSNLFRMACAIKMSDGREIKLMYLTKKELVVLEDAYRENVRSPLPVE